MTPINLERFHKDYLPVDGGDEYTRDKSGRTIYPARIISVENKTKRERLDVHFDVIGGKFDGCYDNYIGQENVFYLVYGTASGCDLTKTRCSCITASNPSIDAYEAVSNEEFELLYGALIGIVMQEVTDEITGETTTRVYKVVEYPFDSDEEAYVEQLYEADYTKQKMEEYTDAAPRVLPQPKTVLYDEILYVDTRQQEGKHDAKHQTLADMGIQMEYQTLETGDYVSANKPYMFIDTKHGVGELANNMHVTFGPRARFIAEIERATADGGMIIFIITAPELVDYERIDGERIYDMFKDWRHPLHDDCNACKDTGECKFTHRPLDGPDVIRGMEMIKQRYGDRVQFDFVATDVVAARYIAALLGYTQGGEGHGTPAE